ncbi:MAG TPA: alpha/beta hydrolase [Stellaceae bacterium]|nr:alpha/beta hydrolase [Stellaceae bacterium]
MALLGGVYALQRSLLYFPDTVRPDPKRLGLASLGEVEIVTGDGLRLLAWYAPPEIDRPVLVYFHGNGGNIADRGDRLRRFVAARFGVLLVEYRGYGGNPGRPSEQGLYADARAALDFIGAQGITANRIILFGESLGTGIAVRMASERPVALLLLEAPYASIAAVARWHYPFLPVDWLLTDRFDALSRIGAVRSPILVMQGGRDTVVPIASGQALFAAAPEPKEIWVAPDGGHNDLPSFGSLAAAIDFVRRHWPAE